MNRHWDKEIRRLSSLALRKLCSRPSAIPYLEAEGIPLLLDAIMSEDLCERHGGMLALGEVMLQLQSQAIPIERKTQEVNHHSIPPPSIPHVFIHNGLIVNRKFFRVALQWNMMRGRQVKVELGQN